MVTILLVWKHLSWFYYWPISCGRSRLIWWETSNPTLPTNNLQPKLLAILLYLLHPPAYTVQCSLPDMSRRHLSHGIPWLDHYDRKHWGISIKDWGQAILLYLQTPSSLHRSVFTTCYVLFFGRLTIIKCDCACCLFFNVATLQNTLLRFYPTLSTNNSSLKHCSIENHYIFVILWTSAFLLRLYYDVKHC